ncbi:DoxX family protein [Wenyingzhuangia marina]|uniref:Putative oxidoreductase n=1 Tax=Wenyingzhuangia marina TaxID=1195760 RepID=A0A1M5U1P3_9FLAO|nr:DoxX family protein [Wenyingzhuangia marina]GGF70013.1 GntR family transcriptional regulator [Wenyingzhuangia marina]SHH56884.1 putative oxidoreductase [Wenyingzhuangia marina]
MKKNTDLGLLVLRIAIGGLMLLHGIAKLKGISYIEGMLTEKGFPSFMAYGVYITEIIAPFLVLIGYRTRLASLVYAFGAIFIILIAHPAEIISLNAYGGWGIELIGLYLLGSITLFFTGGGKLSVSSSNIWD